MNQTKFIQFNNLTMPSHFELVGEFHRVFGIKNYKWQEVVVETPPVEDLILRLDLIAEEFQELFEASFSETAMSKEGKDFAHIFKTLRQNIRAIQQSDIEFDIVEVADALGDIAYVVNGAAHVFNFDLDAVVEEIHSSNMSKLDSNGQVLLREDGKIMKSDLYRRPNIKKVIFNNGDTNE